MLIMHFICLPSSHENCSCYGKGNSQNVASVVGPDLDPICLTLIVFLKELFEKVNFEKIQQMTSKA